MFNGTKCYHCFQYSMNHETQRYCMLYVFFNSSARFNWKNRNMSGKISGKKRNGLIDNYKEGFCVMLGGMTYYYKLAVERYS